MNGSDTQTTNRAGCEIVYQTMGEGPPVLLSHPLYTNRGLWSLFHFVEVLAQRYTLIVYDSIGHGESAKPRDVLRYSQAERAADAVAVLERSRYRPQAANRQERSKPQSRPPEGPDASKFG